MTLTQQTDHVGAALGQFLEQYREQPNIEAFTRAFSVEFQELEDAFWGLLTQRLIDHAVGAQLDVIGRIVQRERLGLSDDDDYRAVLKAWIRANRSNGTGNDILDVLALAIANDATLTNYPPASFVVEIADALTLDAEVIASLIKRSRLGGVGAFVVYSGYDDDESFRFYGGPVDADTEVLGPSRGFATLAENILTPYQATAGEGAGTQFNSLNEALPDVVSESGTLVPAQGAAFLEVTSPSSNDGIYFTYAAEESTEYAFSFDLGKSAIHASYRVRVEIVGAGLIAQQDFDNTSDGTWERKTLTFTTGSGDEFVTISISDLTPGSSDSAFCVDALQLQIGDASEWVAPGEFGLVDGGKLASVLEA